jgi:hypothetical protein
MSQLEAFFSRGDKNLCEFIYELYKNNAYLESWDENLDLELYSKIADKLNIGLPTVITHRKNIMDKLNIKSVSAMTIYAVMNGYVDINKI